MTVDFSTAGLSIDDYTRMASRYSFEEYQDVVLAEAELAPTVDQRYLDAALGLAASTGAYVDEIKKVFFHGKPMELDALMAKLGNILQCVALAAASMDETLEDIVRKDRLER